MRITFTANGVELCREDFGDDLLAFLAYTAAHTASTLCRDRAAAVELWEWNARTFIESVRAGEPRWASDVLDDPADNPREGLHFCDCGRLLRDDAQACRNCRPDPVEL